jgi:hypothetical protein
LVTALSSFGTSTSSSGDETRRSMISCCMENGVDMSNLFKLMKDETQKQLLVDMYVVMKKDIKKFIDFVSDLK